MRFTTGRKAPAHADVELPQTFYTMPAREACMWHEINCRCSRAPSAAADLLPLDVQQLHHLIYTVCLKESSQAELVSVWGHGTNALMCWCLRMDWRCRWGLTPSRNAHNKLSSRANDVQEEPSAAPQRANSRTSQAKGCCMLKQETPALWALLMETIRPRFSALTSSSCPNEVCPEMVGACAPLDWPRYAPVSMSFKRQRGSQNCASEIDRTDRHRTFLPCSVINCGAWGRRGHVASSRARRMVPALLALRCIGPTKASVMTVI
jgi:hypothetical protein